MDATVSKVIVNTVPKELSTDTVEGKSMSSVAAESKPIAVGATIEAVESANDKEKALVYKTRTIVASTTAKEKDKTVVKADEVEERIIAEIKEITVVPTVSSAIATEEGKDYGEHFDAISDEGDAVIVLSEVISDGEVEQAAENVEETPTASTLTESEVFCRSGKTVDVPPGEEVEDVSETAFARWTLEEDLEVSVEEPRVVKEGVALSATKEPCVTKPEVGDSAEKNTASGDPGSRYSRLFTDAELEAREPCEPGQEGTVLASTKVTVEEEDATLAKSDEAKRANRDFRKVATDNAEVLTEEALSGDGSSVVSDEGAESADDAAVEKVVCANIVVPLEANEVVSCVAEVLPISAPFGRKYIRQGTVKGVAREALYRILRELKFGGGETDGVTVPPSDTVEDEGVPSLRDKTPELDWERLRWHADRVVLESGLLGEFWDSLTEWVDDYFSKNAVIIWRKLSDPAGRSLSN
ncbi:hypothetical protein PC128_g18343 [Phytophthora cactorum]|nr:hypothetical protein PC128_g18343 [Phytophthora cactorum]